jgi:hypothetical protein
MQKADFHLDLTLFEAGALVCLLKLGTDHFCRQPVDLTSMRRLDRLPAEALETLAHKLKAATNGMDLMGGIDRLAGNDR